MLASWITCFILAVLMMGAAVYFVFDKKAGKIKTMYILLLCALTVYVLYIPKFFWDYSFFAAFFTGIVNLIKVVAIDAEYTVTYDALKAICGDNLFANVYYGFVAVMHVALPAVSAMTALTVVYTWFKRLELKSIAKRKKDIHIFSSFNYEALILARDIRQNDQNCDILFLEVSDDIDHSDLIRELGCKMANDSIDAVKVRAVDRKVYYYCLSEDQEKSLDYTLSIMENLNGYDSAEQANYHIFLFTTDPESELIIDSLEKGFVNISIVEMNKTAVYNLLFNYPLINYAKNGEINLLISGFNDVAKMALRSALWCGQVFGYKLKITMLVKDRETDISDFKFDFPDLFDGDYNVSVLNYHNEIEYSELLEVKGYDANYVIVAEADSEITVNKAVYLRRFFYKNDQKFENCPPIFAHIENAVKAKVVAALRTPDSKAENRIPYNIIPFGVASDTYSFDSITNSLIENLSKSIHVVYEVTYSKNSPTDPDPNPEELDKDKIFRNYNQFEVNKDGSRANALHIRYKLLSMGFDFTDDPDAEEIDFAEYLKNCEDFENYALWEHNRWMAFLQSEGWTGSTQDEVTDYRASGLSSGSHKCELLKKHPYICAYEELADMSAFLKKKDTRENDRDLIRRIPDILADKWHFTGKSFKIVKKQ